jgi:hypothetical protein
VVDFHIVAAYNDFTSLQKCQNYFVSKTGHYFKTRHRERTRLNILLHINNLMHLVQITHSEGIEPYRGECTSGVVFVFYARGIAMNWAATGSGEFIIYFRTRFWTTWVYRAERLL